MSNSTWSLLTNVLLVLAVMIPAAQFPFHRWLIESVTAPTPVSAIMHAGIVNAGGVILTRLRRYLIMDLRYHYYLSFLVFLYC